MSDVIAFSQNEFKGLGLSAQELSFVHYFVKNGGEADMAAVHAGYGGDHGFVLTKKLHILEAIRRYVLMEFQIDAVKAKKVMVEVMQDEKTPPGVKRQCAKDILDIANLAGGTLMPAGANKSVMDISKLSEVEKDQLEELLAKTCHDPAADSNVIDVNFTEVKSGQQS